MKRIFSILIFVSLLISCSGENSDGVVLLRLTNGSALDFKDIIVNSTSFPDLKAGETSSYKEFETAYRYGYIEAVVEEETLVIQPIDYVGETPLQPGKYTYKLTVYGEQPGTYQLGLEFIED